MIKALLLAAGAGAAAWYFLIRKPKPEASTTILTPETFTPSTAPTASDDLAGVEAALSSTDLNDASSIAGFSIRRRKARRQGL